MLVVRTLILAMLCFTVNIATPSYAFDEPVDFRGPTVA